MLATQFRQTADQLLAEAVAGTTSASLAEEFLRRLAPSLAAFSFVTGSTVSLRQLERALLAQIARFYNRKLSSRQLERRLSQMDLRLQESLSWAMELTFFVPAVGNFLKAGVGARLLRSIGAEIIRSFEAREPHCRWKGRGRNGFRKLSA